MNRRIKTGETNVDGTLVFIDTTSSQTIAKPHVMGSLFALYPNSEVLGLSNENLPVAWFKYEEHANEFGRNKYGKYYVVKTLV